MRQVTGSNHSISTIKVPIRFGSGGHSFSVTLPNRSEGESVEVMLCTTRTMLIPSEVLRTSQREFTHQLNDAGIYVDQQTDKVVTVWGDAISALVVIPSALDRELNAAYNDNFEYMTPMLIDRVECSSEGKFVIVDVQQDLLTLRVFDSSLLRFADIYEVSCVEDVLYRLVRVNDILKLSRYNFALYGCSDEQYSLIKSYFKNVLQCE